MNKTVKIYFIIFSLFIIISCGSSNNHNKITKKIQNPNCCSDDLNDSPYKNEYVLNEIVKTLNLLIPDYYISKEGKGFYITDECRISACNLWDMVDTLNQRKDYDDCVILKEGHIYHFAPMENICSFSSIAVLKNGKVKIFKKVNCPENGGDKIDDVINFIRSYLPINKETEEIIKKVRNYRHYGYYINTDYDLFYCR